MQRSDHNETTSRKVQAAYQKSVAQAINYLTEQGMADDGSYHRQADPGVTALVTTALLRHGLAPMTVAWPKA